ncbi:MAG: EAL domain-containing protein [Pseudomonadales bacterium]|nr:EAL domain-containing protein [Pseudomonadales bacterium]
MLIYITSIGVQPININNKDFLVLVVDDDDAIRFVAQDTLIDAGFNVIEANNGQDALQKFSRYRPDLVLLDLIMPEIDGYEACQSIRAMKGGEHVPIMIMTGLDDAESINKAFEAGATDFITKPLNHLILEQRTRYILRTSTVLKTLEQREARLENAERIANLGSWSWDSRDRQLHVSREFKRILEFDELSTPTLQDVFSNFAREETNRVQSIYQTAIVNQESSLQLEHNFVDSQGIQRRLRHEAEFEYRAGSDYKIIGTVLDITEETYNKDKILQLAYYDTLTSLPNRTFFKAHLEHAIKKARESANCLAVIVLDLDLFTRVNNSLGHDAGDKLLVKVSQRLLEAMDDPSSTRISPAAIDPHAAEEGTGNAIARLEGDQFIILLNSFRKLDDVILLIQKVFKRLSAPITVKANSVVITASAGVALYPVNGQNSERLLRNSDAAMLFAKSQGRNSFRFYSSEIDARSKERLSIENDLRNAMRNGELELHFQPKINLQTRDVRSVEALIRWRHPEKGMISPGQFIPMAEELGMINEMGEWLLHEACRKTKAWNQVGIPPVRTAVNLSALQIKTSNLVEKVRTTLEHHSLIPAQLEVEITENILMEDTHRTLRTLEGLRSLGVRVALDDFGTGYSSLSYLTRFPFTSLKIDRCFITECVRNAQSASIVHTIIQLCKNLNLEVVAEGVEIEEELRFLLERRCDFVQGFYFSPAIDSNSFIRYMKSKPWIDQMEDLD